MEKDTINVLSIDGGGIRGLMSAEIICYIEKKLKELYNKDVKIADHFDYIAGTSTGGILTCIYSYPGEDGRPKFSAQEASDFYMNHGSKIFKKGFRYYLTLGGIFAPRYSSKYIIKLFKNYFKDKKINHSCTNFMVTSIATDNRDLFLFKSYKGENNFWQDRTYIEAAVATSAAPTYFKPLDLNVGYGIKRCLIDGGLGMNNPALSAYIEATKLYPKAKKINVLSIGTGPSEKSHMYKEAKKWGIINGASKLFDITLTSMSDTVCYQLEKLYSNENIEGEFLRLQPYKYYASGKMDDASKKNLQDLKDAGIKSAKDFKAEIDEFLIKSINIS